MVGIKKAKVKICRVDKPSLCKDAGELIIDTGSVGTWVSSSLLRKLKIKPEPKLRKFTTINGQEVKRRWAIVPIEIEGKRGGGPVIFAEKGDKHVLGVTALESAGLAVNPDPKSRKALVDSELLAL